MRKRNARIIAVVLAVQTILSIVILAYAFRQNSQIEPLEVKLENRKAATLPK